MKQFSYQAINSSGQTVQGTLDASTENELIVRLSARGLRVQSIGAAPATPSIQPKLQPVATHTRQAPVVIPTTTAIKSVPSQPIRTRRASYRHIDFLFAQLGSLLHSGINATEAFVELSNRQTTPWLGEVCKKISKLTVEGKTIAEVMALFPDVFTEGQIGAIRAGEAGGYVWQACEALSEQAKGSHRMMWAVRFFRWVILFGLFMVPLTYVATQALEHSFAGMSGLKGYIQGIVLALGGILGVVILIMGLVYLVSASTMRQTKMRPLRHKLGALIPIFSRRSRMESLAMFNWHLSQLSVAGIAPSTAWQLASTAIPNQFFSERMQVIGRRSVEKNRMSELVNNSGLYPPEYTGLIGTAEIAGSLPAALEQVSRLTKESMKTADRYSKLSLYGLYLAAFMVVIIVCASTFYTGYFNSLYKHTVGETEE